ncbi:MAG: RDD family protein [Acidimicrobiia bacterium]|nr:RDD family protein [Acidimicrobiia bacterium]
MSGMPPPPSCEPLPPPGSAAQGSEPMRGQTTTDIGKGVEVAGAGGRLLARLVDIVVVALPASIVASVIIGPDVVVVGLTGGIEANLTIRQAGDTAQVPVGISLAVTATWLVYEVSMIALRGQTLGKWLTRIKVIRAHDSGPPEWSHSLRRWAPVGACTIIGTWVPIVGLVSLLIYLSLVWDQKRQGWHDKAAATLVVKT